MKHCMILFFASVLGLVSSVFAEIETVTGKVVRVSDGDTIELQTEDGTQRRVRFRGIDAPELHQEFGMDSLKFLKSLVGGKKVMVKV